MEELNSQGFVSVNVFSKGKPVSYMMDDLLMVKPYWNQYVDFPFAPLLNDGAAWLIFAEKAFARQNGWYYRIEGGRFGEAIRFLTGAPTREYQTQEFSGRTSLQKPYSSSIRKPYCDGNFLKRKQRPERRVRLDGCLPLYSHRRL